MIRVATVFSGIGAIEHALIRTETPHTITFACDNGGVDIWAKMTSEEEKRVRDEIRSESDPHRRKERVDAYYRASKRTNFVEQAYKANYAIADEHFHQDAMYVDGRAYRGKVDLFVGGSPCQAFSIAGKRGGFEDTRGTLFYEFARLVDEVQPEVFIYENVKGLLNHDKGRTWKVVQQTFDDLGYTWYSDVLNAKDYGIPQSRPRVFVVGFKTPKPFRFPEAVPLESSVKDYLLDAIPDKYYLSERASRFVLREDMQKKAYTQVNGRIALCQQACQQYNLHGDFIYEPIEEKYFLSDKLISYVLSEGTKGFKVRPTIDTPVAKTLLATMTKMHRASIDNYVTTEGRLRKLTPRECLRLMGFHDDFDVVVSDTQAYRQAGNSIVVDVLIALLREIERAGAWVSPEDASPQDSA